MTKRKPARELTTEGALRRLFPPEVRKWLKRETNGDRAFGKRPWTIPKKKP